MNVATRYVVYRFYPGEKVNLDDPSHILCITDQTMLPLGYQGGNIKWKYVVTSLDRMQNDSKGVKKTIRL